MNYAEDRHFKATEEGQFDPVSLPSSDHPLFVTQPASNFGFRAGLLNSNVNGRYVVVVEPHQVNRVAECHQNKVDLIATE